MTTKFYFPSYGFSAIKVNYDPYWDDTHRSIQRVDLVTVPIHSPMVEITTYDRCTSNPDGRNILVRQYISAPLAQQLIAGVFEGHFQTTGAGFDTQFFSQVIVKVVSNDGSIVRGILYDGDEEANPHMISLPDTWVNTLTNRFFPRGSVYPILLTPVQTQLNDRLVIELGYRSLRSSFAIHQASMRFGDNGIGDLPSDQVNTSNNLNPWCSFSNSITVLQ